MNTVSLTQTPTALRVSIGFFGRTNSGKSSLLNALAGQEVSLVSPVPGTTTDPVSKPIEVYPLGPCVFLDTAGFADNTPLGAMRIERTMTVLDKTDIAILVMTEADDYNEEKGMLEELKKRNIPTISVLNKIDVVQDVSAVLQKIEDALSLRPLPVSVTEKKGIDTIKEALVKEAPAFLEDRSLIEHLVKEGDRVLLVMPQDKQAPKGRLIMPQVQTLRDLLDHNAIVTCVTLEGLKEALQDNTPNLIITDSQVFSEVYPLKPAESKLTSFSVLLARYKGDIEAYFAGAKTIHSLKAGDKVLIAEACSHKPLDGDIGRVKIPKLIHEKINPGIDISVVAGQDFPQDLTPYALVIHCGGCMFNRRQILSRVMRAVEQKVPITNYGIFLAEMTNILDKITI